MAEIAFWGLGTMGLPMALNLLKAKHRVHIMPHKGHMENPRIAERHGAVIHTSLTDMLEQIEFVVSVVPDDRAVREIYLNETMKKLLKPGCIIIEMTSCSPETVREVQAFYAESGVSVIDAPITGALPRAINGTLTILGAGKPDDFEKAAPVLNAMAEKTYQLGAVGNGKLIKAMTNLLGAVNLAAVGEFFRFASTMGLDLSQLADVVKDSAGGSMQFTRNFGKMVEHDYSPTFTLRLLRKDMGIALDQAAKQKELAMPLSDLAYRLYKEAEEYDASDCSAIALVDGTSPKSVPSS